MKKKLHMLEFRRGKNGHRNDNVDGTVSIKEGPSHSESGVALSLYPLLLFLIIYLF